MIKINLLSPLDKENLKWEKANNLAIKCIIWTVLAQVVFVGVFLFSVEYLKTEKDAVAAQSAALNSLPETREVNAIERDLKLDKSKVEGIYAIQSGHIGWTSLFENISKLTPAGVRLESISSQDEPKKVDNATGAATGQAVKVKDERIQIEIVGNAKTRDLLLTLEKNLKSSDMFFDLQYDTANYVESVDIDFKYTFYASKQKLLK